MVVLRKASVRFSWSMHIARAPRLTAFRTRGCTGLSVEVGRQLVAVKGESGSALVWGVYACVGVGPGEMEELREACTGSSVELSEAYIPY